MLAMSSGEISTLERGDTDMPGNKNSGRRAVPLKVLELEGKSVRRPRPEIPKSSGLPEKPIDLTAIQSQHWDDIVRTRGDWLDVSDGFALLRLCQEWEICGVLMAASLEDPLNHHVRASYSAHMATWMRLTGMFGLTPAERASRVTEKQESVRSAAEKFLA